jgi:DNA-binding response OmpR family regulator
VALQGMRYDIVTARSGQETLDIDTVITPTLIIADMALKDISGFDCLRNRCKKSVMALVPIIIKMANPTEETAVNCSKIQCSGCN